jgi:predicted amidohydrolase YtcJ
VRAALDAYEAAQDANGKRDSRHQITHRELVDPADISRFEGLGVIANIQALWAYPDTYIVDLTQPKIAPERSEWLYPFGVEKGWRCYRWLKRLERVVDEPAGGDPDRRDAPGHCRP